MITEAIILAAGLGTRLSSVVNEVPKPMAPIDEVPFMEFLMIQLSTNGIKRVIIATSWLGHVIADYFGDNYSGIEIVYDHTDVPLGTGGNVRSALRHTTTDRVLVLNGDSICHYDLSKLEERNADFAMTLLEVDDTTRYGRIDVDGKYVTKFKEKGVSGRGLINGGVILVNTSALIDCSPDDEVFSFEELLSSQNNIQYNEVVGSFFIDIGTPADYDQMCNLTIKTKNTIMEMIYGKHST